MSRKLNYWGSYSSFQSLKALCLNGVNQYVNVPDDNTLDFTNKMTISVKIRPTVITGFNAIITKWDYATQGTWTIAFNNSEIQVFMASSLTDAGGNNIRTAGSGILINEWNEITLVYDGTLSATNRALIYVNGNLISTTKSGTIPATLPNSSASVKIGRWGGALTRYYSGKQDKITIFNDALTSSEVTELVATDNLQSFSKYSNLVSWYEFEDSDISGVTLQDRKGNNDGQLINGATNCLI